MKVSLTVVPTSSKATFIEMNSIKVIDQERQEIRLSETQCGRWSIWCALLSPLLSDFEHIPRTFPPVVKSVDAGVSLNMRQCASDEAGTMNPKLYTLLQVYDEFAAITRGWIRK